MVVKQCMPLLSADGRYKFSTCYELIILLWIKFQDIYSDSEAPLIQKCRRKDHQKTCHQLVHVAIYYAIMIANNIGSDSLS